MKCANCSKEVAAGKKFCPSCGKPVSCSCPHCGNACEPGDAFCGSCGQSLTAEKSVAAQATTQAPPSSTVVYPSKIEKGEFESSRKHITVLFADIKGSTSLIEGHDPEEAKRVLGPAIEEMISAVYRFDGTIIHTAGDGITAIFGAPQALEDHALRACFAALAMQAKIKSLNDAIKIRVGLNSGEVLLEIVGDSRHLEYDVVGPAVNLAARMEQTAEPGSIQLTRETLKLVEKNVEVFSLGQIQVKGFPDPIDVFKLKSLKETRTLFDAEARRSHVPFVGRDEELLKLKQLLEQAKSGEGKAASVVGEAGLGKTRIIYELTHSKEAKSCTLLAIGAFSHTYNINLFPIVKLFRELIQIEEFDTLDEIKIKIQPFLADIDKPHAMNALMELLQLPVKDKTWEMLDPPIKRRLMFDIGIKILLNMSANQPLILVLEDLHWIDSETEAFLDLLLSQINHSAILLLFTYRPEYHDHWLTRPNYIAIKLNALQKSTGEALLDLMLGNDFSLIDLKSKLINEYGGNPFFLEEMVKHFVSENILIGSVGHYRLNTAQLISCLQLPETIFAVIQSQIDKLPSKQKKVLQVSSVVGQRFTYSLLAQVIEMDQKELRNTLNTLYTMQYVYEAQIYPEPEFAFKHALIQEVSYSTLLKASRRALHLKILTILEKRVSENPSTEEMQLLANHAYLGEEWNKAFLYCRLAGEKLAEMSSLKLSVQFYERALAASQYLPNEKEVIESRIRIDTDMIHLLTRLGRFVEQGVYLDKAMELAVKENNQFIECILYSLKSHNFLCVGKTMPALESALKADELADKIKSVDAKITSQFFLTYSYIFLGKYLDANKVGESLLGIIPDINYSLNLNKMPYWFLINFYLMWGNAYSGNFEYIENKKEMWLKAVNLDEASLKSYLVIGGMGLYHFFKGQYEEAIPYLLRALKYARDLETIITIPAFAAALAVCYAQLNKKEEAREYLSQAINTGKIIRYTFIGAFALGLIAEGLLMLEEHEEVKEFLADAFPIIEERELLGQKPWLLRIQAENELELPNPDYAVVKRQLDEALQLAIDLNMPSHVAHCRLALAKLHRIMNNTEAAQKELQEAIKIYQQLDMPFWVKQCQPLTV